MILDVGALLRGEKNRITFDYKLAPIPMDRVKFRDDAHVVGEITDSAGYMQLVATAHLAYEAQCDRCLDSVAGEFVLDFDSKYLFVGWWYRYNEYYACVCNRTNS